MRICLLSLVVFLSACGVSRQAQQTFPAASGELKLLDVYEVPFNFMFRGTTVGGLSSIDYDAARNVYYMICDDRSAINPARFYTARILINNNRIDTVQMLAVDTLRQANGNVFPDNATDPAHSPDPESIRYNAATIKFVWSSEGERIVKNDKTVLEDPAIYMADKNGKVSDSFLLPAQLKVQAVAKGPRQNGVFEGLAFSNHYKTLYASVEEPLFEDGPRAGLKDSTAWVRILQFDTKTKKQSAQFAYRIDAVAHAPQPANGFKLNGIPEILYAGDDRLLVIERSYSVGMLTSTIKIYLADLKGATDVSNVSSLLQTPAARPVSKKLLLNMDSLGVFVDNVEGITFGPRLPNGHQTLVLVSDNNFSSQQKTQFFLLEIVSDK